MIIKRLISKENSRAEHEYMNIQHPPPPPPLINALVSPLRLLPHIIQQFIYLSMKLFHWFLCVRYYRVKITDHVKQQQQHKFFQTIENTFDVRLFSSFYAMTSSVIYYSTHARQNEFYLLNVNFTF